MKFDCKSTMVWNSCNLGIRTNSFEMNIKKWIKLAKCPQLWRVALASWDCLQVFVKMPPNVRLNNNNNNNNNVECRSRVKKSRDPDMLLLLMSPMILDGFLRILNQLLRYMSVVACISAMLTISSNISFFFYQSMNASKQQQMSRYLFTVWWLIHTCPISLIFEWFNQMNFRRVC